MNKNGLNDTAEIYYRDNDNKNDLDYNRDEHHGDYDNNKFKLTDSTHIVRRKHGAAATIATRELSSQY